MSVLSTNALTKSFQQTALALSVSKDTIGSNLAYLKLKLLAFSRAIFILFIPLIFIGCGPYTVKFLDDNDEVIATLSTNENITTIHVPTAPNKAGYTFTGWKEVGGSVIIAANAFYYIPRKDVTFKAQYALSVPADYTAIFLDDSNNEIATLKAPQSSPITTPAAPAKAYYTFIGWQDVDKSKTIAASVSYALTKNVVFKARYTLNSGYYKVAFYDADLELLSSDIITAGSAVNLNAKSSSLHMANWYRASQSSPTSGTFTPQSSINFYAAPDIIEITDQAGLNNIRNTLTGKYILTNDIALDSNGVGFDADGWQPIGANPPYPYENPPTPFIGILNGDGYVISNLWIDRPSTYNVGLFGYAQSSTIKNLGVLIGSGGISGYNSVGGIVGEIGNESTIAGSYTTGNVVGVFDVGGIAGYIYGSLTDSYSTGDISGDSSIGGIAGDIHGTTVTNSYSIGRVSGDYSAGGIAGEVWTDSQIINCYSTGTIIASRYAGGIAGFTEKLDSYYSVNRNLSITKSYSTGSIIGRYGVGGIVGSFSGDSVTNSYSTGNIDGDEAVGGIAGYGGKINNSYSTGNISGGTSVGGISGYNGIITNSYSTGSISANQYVGGIVGTISVSSVTNSYATGSVKGDNHVGGIVGYIKPDIPYPVGLPNYDSTITNNAAINQAVIGSSKVNPILGYVAVDLGKIKNNFARSAMEGSFTGSLHVANSGIGKADSEFKSQSTYSNGLGWKFGNNDANPWRISASKNGGYPYLYWQE
jgi:hypothetical protein